MGADFAGDAHRTAAFGQLAPLVHAPAANHWNSCGWEAGTTDADPIGMKTLVLSALAVALTSGSAVADRWRDRPRSHHPSSSTRTWSDATRTWSGGVHVQPSNVRWRSQSHEGRRSNFAVARRPIFVRAPIIHRRYFNVRYRPQVVVENYAPIAGYYWVSGRWDWNGVEWTWTAGHYEPDPSYAYPTYSDPTYAPSYDPTYAPHDPNCAHNRY